MTGGDDGGDDTGSPADPNPADDTADPGPPTDDSGDLPTPPTEISEDHPRVFFSPPDFPQLQGRIYDPRLVDLVTTWDEYVNGYRDPSAVPLGEGMSTPGSDEEWQSLAAPLPNLALFTLFTSDEEMKAQVIEWMTRVAAIETWGVGENPVITAGAQRTLQNFCLAFDLLHDEIPPPQRSTLRSKIISQATQLNNALSGPAAPSWANQWSGRDAQLANLTLLIASLILEHNHDPAAAWLERTINLAEDTVDGLSMITDGSWPEGPGLGSDALDSAFKTIFLVERHFGLDFETLPWFSARSEAMVRTAVPNQLSQMASGDGSGEWYQGPVEQACFVDQFSSVNLATWQANQYILAGGSNARGTSLWLEFLWCEAGSESAAPGGDMSPSHHFDDWGTVTWHNGFTEGNSSLIVRAGEPVSTTTWNNVTSGGSDGTNLDMRHLHPDAGSFGWYPNGTPVITTGRDQAPKRTQLENTYTFGTETAINRGWTATDREDWWPSSSFYSDVGDLSQVGQLGEWDLAYGPIGALSDAAADIEFRETKRRVTVIGAEISQMYPNGFNTDFGWQPLGLERVARYWVILDNGIVFILDNLRHSSSLTHYRRFNSAYGGFSVSGITATVSSADGYSWIVDAASGGSLLSDQLVGDVTSTSPSWINQLVVSNSAGPGSHHHLTILRSTSQSVVLTGWTPTEQGVTADMVVTDEVGLTTYSIRFASSSEPVERQAYLGFEGTMGITRNTETEIRF